MMRPISVLPYLTPEPTTVAPKGFTVVEEQLIQGLPHAITLDNRITLTVLLPHGLAHAWRDADPEAIVCTSKDKRRALTKLQHVNRSQLPRPPLRLMVQVDSVFQASVPTVASLRVNSPQDGNVQHGVKLEFVLLDWLITAGTVRSMGDYGSRIRLAWRRRGLGTDDFTMPPINPNIVPRLNAEQVFVALVTAPTQFETVVYSSVTARRGG